MRGGIARWKRGIASQGVRQALDYAFGGTCDASHDTPAMLDTASAGAHAAEHYADEVMARYTATDAGIETDVLSRRELGEWLDGVDPKSGIQRGRALPSADADLVLDATINAPKSYSIAALIDGNLAAEYEALQDRLRDRIISTWHRELNARRGAGGLHREELAQLEVVELRHERSRSLDPHKHRHLWLNMKVQGRDGKWSNLDSRVALKFQTVVNAEGDLAARTDPQWIAALAARGFTLDASGEIAQLAHAVRPLSRRSNQIEANRASRLAEWHEANPGEEPSVDVLRAIDRWAWAYDRPNKPADLDEDEWAGAVRDELAAIDPALLSGREAVEVQPVDVDQLDRDALAIAAIADADRRSRGSAGRFSQYDVRAGATRALAASGVVADRAVFDELIEDVSHRAIGASSVDLVAGEERVPGHVKHLMATDTVVLKEALGQGLDALVIERAGTAEVVDRETMTALVAAAEDGPAALNSQQADAAGAIAGTGRLVTVTGPAGTGKTTMLRAARAALDNQGRRMVIAAPTKKAASVAGREVGAAASSLHALLLDHGWHTITDQHGREQWRQYAVGETTGAGLVYEGPRRYVLQEGDRIVIDEAGMVDLGAAQALVDVTRRTGAGLALVGDQYQAAPVGHTGAMAMAVARAEHSVELEQVHRFKDPNGSNEPDTAYAALSLRMRHATTQDEAQQIAQQLQKTGRISTVTSEHEAGERMIAGYFEHHERGRSVALVTATNEAAQSINERIQRERISRGEISTDRAAVGQNDQVLHVGDVVQTRRNSTDLDVENRSLWTVAGIGRHGELQLQNLHTPSDTRVVPADYVAQHVHLAYASTVHGVQGETVDAAIVADGVNASGLYVGMTRGRRHNEIVTVAATPEKAVDRVASSILRGKTEHELTDSRSAALSELGRAARMSVVDAKELPAWNSKERRYGHLAKPERQLEQIAEPLRDLRRELGDLSDQIARDRRTRRQLDERLEAPDADHVALRAAREGVERRIVDADAAAQELTPNFRRHVRTAEALRVEIALRENQKPAVLEQENTDRAANMAPVGSPKPVQRRRLTTAELGSRRVEASPEVGGLEI